MSNNSSNMCMKHLTDNSKEEEWTKLLNNNWEKEDLNNLRSIANKYIKTLTSESNSNLLVFPDCLDYHGDGIGEQCILRITEDKDKITITTGNIMGFIGVNGTEFQIKSRFAEDDENDYFLHYLLQKVCAINLFDLQHGTSKEPVFDFLFYLFPHYLKKALSQGMFKQYRKFEYNDANVRGAINVNRHIRENIPFKGTIAYSTKEYSYDNDITELIRHTIEVIASKPFGKDILKYDSYTSECVRQIVQVTPSYSASARLSVINRNIRPVKHPYYSSYTPLQKICIQILRHDGIKFGNDPDKIYGVLFDGAWLWEEYLNTILQQEKFTHPKNKEKSGGLKMFSDPKDDKRLLFPDFYKKDDSNKKVDFILDAKYKHLEKEVDKKEVDREREDLYQMVTYMHCLKAEQGAFVYPVKEEHKRPETKTLEGDGGNITTIPFLVPQQKNNWGEFCESMEESASDFLILLGNVLAVTKYHGQRGRFCP